MRNIKYFFLSLTVSLLLMACENTERSYDASGSFEAIERTISAEATGKIMSLNLEEGQQLKAGDTIGFIDVTNLSIQSEQIQASIQAIRQKTNNASAQVAVLESQLKTQEGQTATIQQQLTNTEKEVSRFQKLVKANAVPPKQLDDLIAQKLVLQQQLGAAKTQAGVINAQIKATKDNINTQNRAILSEVEPGKKKLALIEQQIKDGTIVNDYSGTVTTQIAYDGEFTSVGRPLYKIADLENIYLRTYITGDQLPQIKLNQEVIVRTDDGKGGFIETTGLISWISSKAEFTPKTIQTKDERANLVYATKVKVKNDGTYKMGMYGEIKFE